MKEFSCPSGAVLKVDVSPFKISKALYQACLKEMRAVTITKDTEMGNIFFKDLLCIGFSSPEIEACLWDCFKRCTYNSGKGDFKINDETFEPLTARDDYIFVCIEVTKENVLPFAKSLYANWLQALPMTGTTPA